MPCTKAGKYEIPNCVCGRAGGGSTGTGVGLGRGRDKGIWESDHTSAA